MFRRILFAAAAAGLIAGLLVTALHAFTTTPLILEAEKYEKAGAKHSGTAAHTHSAAARVDDGRNGPPRAFPASTGDESAWAPADGWERTLFSGLANLVLGVGFGLLLTAGFALRGGPVDARQGALWGVAGFAVFTLAPALGLAPELPGSAAADLTSRQLWWAGTVVATAAGLGLLVFGGRRELAVAGVVLLVLPHAIGAPHPAKLAGTAPPELAGQFAASSIVVSAVFWVVLGIVAGAAYAWLAKREGQRAVPAS